MTTTHLIKIILQVFLDNPHSWMTDTHAAQMTKITKNGATMERLKALVVQGYLWGVLERRGVVLSGKPIEWRYKLKSAPRSEN